MTNCFSTLSAFSTNIFFFLKCRVLDRYTNNEKLVDIWEYHLYFYSLTATFVWSRNTIKESSHLSFFCGRDRFCKVVRRLDSTHGELTGLLEWPAGLSKRISPLRLSNQRIFPFVWVTSGFLRSVQNYRPYTVFSSPVQTYEHLRLTYFLFMAGFRKLHTSVFFR